MLMPMISIFCTAKASPDADLIDITIKPRFKAFLTDDYFFEIHNRNKEPIQAEVTVTTSIGTQHQTCGTPNQLRPGMKWHPAVGAQGVFSTYELTARAGNFSVGAPSSQVKSLSVKGFMLFGFYFVR